MHQPKTAIADWVLSPFPCKLPAGSDDDRAALGTFLLAVLERNPHV